MSDVVVFSPHADDETLGMGGTVAKMALAGAEVTVVCVTEHRSTHRHDELEKACEILGASCRKLLDWSGGTCLDDGMLDRDRRGLVASMDRCLNELEPVEVYLPYPSPHQDHRATYEAGVAACRVSLDPKHWWVTDIFVYGEAVAELDLYPTGLRWNCFVDIEGEPLERKMHAIAAHASQSYELPLPSNQEFLVSEAVQAGGQAMMIAAERFAVLRMSR